MTKGLKTFNLRHSTIAIVRKKPNQSQFVDRAIVKLHKAELQFDITDVPTRSLMWALSRRDDCPRSIVAIVEDLMINQ